MPDPTRSTRTKVIGIFRQGDRILALRVIDPTNGRTIYVPLGGGVEFGEHSEAALRREMQEELGTAIDAVRFLGVIENRFTFAGKSAHEIDFIYEATFPDRSRYAQEHFVIIEPDGTRFEAQWVDVVSPAPGGFPLCPEGLTELLKKTSHHATESPRSFQNPVEETQ